MVYVSKKRSGIWATSLAVIVIGSIWGSLEMSLGGFLHTIHLPQKGAIMGGLAISLMTVFYTQTSKPSLIPLLGLIAASFKPFSAVVFKMPLLSPFVVNPAIAIIMQALAFSGVMIALRGSVSRRLFVRAGAGVLAGFLGYAFYAVFASVFGLGKWPTLDLTAKLRLVLSDATPIAIAGAIMLIAGYFIGRASLPRLSTFKEAHPRYYYAISLLLASLAWMIPMVFRLGA